MHVLSNVSPNGGQRAGENWGGGESNTWKCSESRGVPQSQPAQCPPYKHRASLKVWAAILSTTSFWTGEPQRWARGEGKESRCDFPFKMWLCVIPYVCTTLNRHTGRWEGLSLKAIISHTCCPPPASTPLPPRQSQPEEKDCSKELKQENTYWSFISDAINQIHNPENVRVGTSKKANCARDSYSEQNLLWGPASGWLCRPPLLRPRPLSEMSVPVALICYYKSCCFPLKW